MSDRNRVRHKLSGPTVNPIVEMPKVKDPFVRLPNELFDLILNRIELQKLIFLRLVNTRWLGMIESMCHKKKLLALSYFVKYYVFKLMDRFDGQLDLSRLVYLKLKPVKNCLQIKLSAGLCALLGKLFPNLEHLFVDETVANKAGLHHLLGLWPASLVTLQFAGEIFAQNVPQVCSQLNAMTNLKNLDFMNDNGLPLKSLVPILERLHSFSFCMFGSPQATCDVLVNSLGRNCISLSVYVEVFNRDFAENMQIRTAQAPITNLHLDVLVIESKDFIFRIFPRHFAPTLKSLHITDHNLYLQTPSVLTQLSFLTALTDIRLDGEIKIFLSPGDAPPTPVPNIRSLALYNFNLISDAENKEELFCRFFSIIFPNLERLTLRFWHASFGEKIRPFLYLFKALRYHDILCLYSA